MYRQCFLPWGKKKTPWYAKLFVALTVAYALSPIDIVPDFIPVLGYFDDLLIIPLLVALTVKCIPSSVGERCRTDSEDIWKDGTPKKVVLCRTNYYFLAYRKSNFLKIKAEELLIPLLFNIIFDYSIPV